jgi:hypothetical protein
MDNTNTQIHDPDQVQGRFQGSGPGAHPP